METKTYKIILLGDGGTGKTAYLKRVLTDEFEKRYLATLGVEVSPYNLDTSDGLIKFSVWDTAGQEKFSGLKSGYYIDADCAMIFYDSTSNITFKNIHQWAADFRKICPNAPIIIVQNKGDVSPSKITLQQHESLTNITPHICQISVKSGFNLELPALLAAKTLMNNPDWGN